MKGDRLSTIESIIAERAVSTQEELQALLSERGFNVTQATVSRDIKVLGLTKVVGENGEYRYMLSKAKNDEVVNARFINIFKASVLKIVHCENLVIIKCHTGTANAAAMALDALNLSAIQGTVAGDDTIFCAVFSEDGPKVRSYLEDLLNRQ
ncbi:MAG: arginine repressor [Oscillospiraceae bacterium]|nr:arginine repressor [Oscillospiraceae bacterium]